ncbi:MAG: PorT family protein [Prolixibacteraceae bacterium]|nr:PorT family protein [Prolixibacteraceae bacterium]
MKNRLLSIVLILALSASFAIAQEPGKMSFGILGGVNFQNLNGKFSSGDKLENDMLMGFHGGVNVQIPIAPEFYFQPGVMYAIKGAKSTPFDGNYYTKTTKINYIEVPLNLVYKGALGNGFVMLGFGPYVAYGIGGKVETEVGSVTVEKDIEFKNEAGLTEYPVYKAFDAGANIFVGFEMASGIFLQLDTQFGMLNINPDRGTADDKSASKNTGFGLSLGYRF